MMHVKKLHELGLPKWKLSRPKIRYKMHYVNLRKNYTNSVLNCCALNTGFLVTGTNNSFGLRPAFIDVAVLEAIHLRPSV